VLVLLLPLSALESMLIKNYFHARNFFSFLTTIRVRSQFTYLEIENFPLFLIYQYHIECTTKSIRRHENPFRSVSDFLRFHRVQGK
jgi:hypothetical protein